MRSESSEYWGRESQSEGTVNLKSWGHLACLKISEDASVVETGLSRGWEAELRKKSEKVMNGKIMWSLNSYFKDFLLNSQ